jgi:hypothetical protein
MQLKYELRMDSVISVVAAGCFLAKELVEGMRPFTLIILERSYIELIS